MRTLSALAFTALLVSFSPARAEYTDGLLQETWAAADLNLAVTLELSELDTRRAEAVAAYNNLGTKLTTYHGWCSTYGITALRKVIEGRLFMSMFSAVSYPAYYVYSNDPYFAGMRGQLDDALARLRTTAIDVGKCALTEIEADKLQRDPKHFERGSDEFRGSNPYVLLAGNLRLIEEEREILLELRGMITGTGQQNDSATVEKFVRDSYGRLHGKIQELRARTLEGYENGFRVPFGPLEVYNGKELGFRDSDPVPNFFWIFERRAYYVNQARQAAGRLFEVSVANFTKAEVIQDRFLQILREAQGR